MALKTSPLLSGKKTRLFNPHLISKKTNSRLLPAALKIKPAPSFSAIYLDDPMELIQKIKQGVDAHFLLFMARTMKITKERLLVILGLPRATIDRKIRTKKVLSPDESSRVLGLARLIGQAQILVEESGKVQGFIAAEWVATWLDLPQGALGGSSAAQLMDTAEGQSIITQLLQRVQTSAYS
jgi:putative toxin-antitoxin system antitoxin component (TIGR02293 family)